MIVVWLFLAVSWVCLQFVIVVFPNRLYFLGPNKHGLVTYIQLNVYIGNTLSWLNGGELSKLTYIED